MLRTTTDIDADDAWPHHGAFVVPWRTRSRGPRADRLLTAVTTAVPPEIGPLVYRPRAADARLLRTTTAAVRALEHDAGAGIGPLGAFLVRTESVASSRIEHVEADLEDYARALVGIRANDSATTMVAATRAVTGLLDAVGRSGRITVDALLDAHRELLADDPVERAHAGRFRTVQNWIGGSDHSPRGATHVPPTPESVPWYMADLVAFANRDDVDPVVQAAIVHAQFECVHPFTDGNGRIGRALLGAVFRRRGLTHTAVVPVASAMIAERDRYFALLEGYRDGDAAAFVGFVAACTIRAADAARESVARLQALPRIWRAVLGTAGRDVAPFLDHLLGMPVLTSADVERSLGVTPDAAAHVLDLLVAAGILHPLTDRRRDQAWGVTEVLDELDRLDTRIARAA